MKGLSIETFSEALTLCSQHSNYKVYVLFDDMNMLDEFVSSVSAENIPGVHTKKDDDYTNFSFYNKSQICVRYWDKNTILDTKCNYLIVSTICEISTAAKEYLLSLEEPYHYDAIKELHDKVLFSTNYEALKAVDRIKKELKQNELRQIDDTEVDNSEELDKFLSKFKISKKNG